MKHKVRKFSGTKEVKMSDGYHTILIYGECRVIKNHNYTERVVDNRTVYNKSNDIKSSILTTVKEYKHVKVFSMGCAICRPCDKFNLETGLALAKKRLTPKLTTESFHLLDVWACNDMIDREFNHLERLMEQQEQEELLNKQ